MAKTNRKVKSTDEEIVPTQTPLAEAVIVPITADGEVPMVLINKISGTVADKKDQEIYDIRATSMTLGAGSSLKVQAGSETKLTVSHEPFIANEPTLIWESSDINVAYIRDGILTAQQTEGTATITATSIDGKLTGSFTLEVYYGVPVNSEEGEEKGPEVSEEVEETVEPKVEDQVQESETKEDTK